MNGRVFVAWIGIVNGWLNLAEISVGYDRNGVPFIQGLIPRPGKIVQGSTNTTPGLGNCGNQLVVAYANYYGPGTAQPIEIMWTGDLAAGDLAASPNDLTLAGPYDLLDQTGRKETTDTGLQITGTQTRGVFLAWVGHANVDVSIANLPMNANVGSTVIGTSKRTLFRLTGAGSPFVPK